MALTAPGVETIDRDTRSRLAAGRKLINSYPFIFKINTSNTSIGSTASNQFKLPLLSDGVYSFAVNWGDNSSNHITTWNDPAACHAYTKPGIYTITITITGNGRFKGWKFDGTGDCLKMLEIMRWGCIRFTDGHAFSGCANLTISTRDRLNLTGTTSLEAFFMGCLALTDIPNIGLWDVSSITTMALMFHQAYQFNGDIGDWNTKNVTDMSYMFACFSDPGQFNQDIGDWDTSNVIDMAYMFCSQTQFNQDISRWAVGSVKYMESLFEYTLAFNKPLGTWLVDNVESMKAMFGGSAFNQDIGAWNVGNVKDMSYMFYGTPVVAEHFNQDIGDWGVSSVTDMSFMFADNKAFNTDIGNWDVSSVTDMSYMFSSDDGNMAFNQNIGRWGQKVANVTTMDFMFSEATAFNQDISSWNVENVTTMKSMFMSATSFKQDISAWSPIALTDATDMFSGIDINNPDSDSNQDNYNALLISWASKAVQSNVIFGGGNAKYSAGSPEDSRYYLTTIKGWIITDAGGVYVPMILTVDTTKTSTGSTAATNFKLPLIADGRYAFIVNWGDDNSNHITTWNDPAIDHTYAIAGVYTVTITGPCLGWMFNNSGDKLKLISILQWGNGWRFAGVSTVDAYAGAMGHFYGCANLDILASDGPRMDAPVVNNESYLAYPFFGCTNLRSIGNPAAWNLRQLTDMWQAFYGCTNFDQDLGALDVSHLNGYMSSIFRFCTSFNNGGSPSIANWDVSKWENCSSLFGGSCYAFNQELGAWNTSSLLTISFMFNNATSFNNGDPGDNQAKPSLDNWNLSSVYQAPGVFSGASKFNQMVSSWRFPTCIDIASMFQNCPLFNNGGDPGIDGWTVGACVTFNSMFQGATVFNQPIGSWDVSKGTAFNEMFSSATAFNQDISGWNVENGVSFANMFNSATSFKRNVGAWWLRSASGSLTNMFASNDMNVGNSPVQKLTSPQDYSNSSWTKTNATVTTNTTGSPDGTTTADKIKPSATNSTDHSVKQTVTVSAGVNYTVRVAVKAVELTYAQLICTGAIASDVYVDLSTGSVVSSNGTVDVTDLGNGWYVVSISGTTASTSLVVQIKAWNNSAGTSFAGNASDGIALWQASAFDVASSTDNYSAFLRDITGWTGSGDGAATRTGVMSAVVAVGGSGYTVGDVLSVVGGTLGVGTQPASVRVATVDGSGAVVTVTVKRGSGNYDTQPSNAAATTGGTGNGCTLTLTWGTKFAGLPASKSFHGGTAKYSMVDRRALNARKNLVLAVGSGGKGWTITDGGPI